MRKKNHLWEGKEKKHTESFFSISIDPTKKLLHIKEDRRFFCQVKILTTVGKVAGRKEKRQKTF